MNKVKTHLTFVVSFALVLAAVPVPTLQAIPPSSAPTAPPWPRVFDRNGAHIVVYQPQVKSWRSYRSLIAVTAISVTQPNSKPILGVISWHADTITDVNSRTVFIRNIEVVSSRFPYLDATQEAAMQQRARQIYPTMTFTNSLDRMIASVEKANTPVQTITANTQPPPNFRQHHPVDPSARRRQPGFGADSRNNSSIRCKYELGSFLR